MCKQFFLTTLCISQKTIYNVHKNKNPLSFTPPDEKRGKNTKSRIPNDDRLFAFNHIASFPTVASHYCRADSQKQYLDSQLNVTYMYKLYLTLCQTQPLINPVSIHMYRSILNNEFNLEFFVPKKDLCDLCEEYKVLQQKSIQIPETKLKMYEEHILKKQNMRLENELDRNTIDREEAIVSFDLENVLTLPKTNVGSAFYKRKICAYNMTAHLKMTSHSKIYCALWHEGIVGRSGNDMASAVYHILNKIYSQNPTITRITTWSDSCVPQNRNSIMSSAMISFLLNNPGIQHIIMKFSTPGHSGIQSVDNAHSQIQKYFKNIEVWSPLTLFPAMLKVNYKNPFDLIILDENSFKNYYELSKLFKFNKIPFATVSQLKFTQLASNIVQFKNDHGLTDFNKNDICKTNTADIEILKYPKVTKKSLKNAISEEKKKDIMDMYKFMPDADIEFYNKLFSI